MNKKIIPLILLSTALLMTGCAKKEKGNSGEAPTSGQPGQTSQTPTGSVVSFAAADFPAMSAAAAFETTKSGVKVAISQGLPDTQNNAIRIYKGKTLTISGVTFTKIEMTFSDYVSSKGDHYDGGGLGELAGWTLASDKLSGVWTGSSDNLTFTATNYQTRAVTINVTLA